MARDLVTIDFETEPIERRPKFPPEPVGVALLRPGQRPVYRAWGHPEGNNCTREAARAELVDIFKPSSTCDVLVFNAQFDLAVAHERLGLPPLVADRVHDAQTLAFLNAPDAGRLALKELAEDLLGIPPTERDDLRDWITENVRDPVTGRKLPKRGKGWGAFIARAPARLVGPYACADVEMTRRLYDVLAPRVLSELDMGRPYRTEQRLLPCLMEMERRGVPLDADRLADTLSTWEGYEAAADAWLRERLAAPQLNVDSNDDLADALEAAGVVGKWLRTEPSMRFPEGQRSVAWPSMVKAVKDAEILAVLKYRSKLTTCLRTFARPWLETAGASGGLIYCQWNAHGRQDGHAAPRTGRLSSSPNLQNVPKAPDRVAFGEVTPELKAEAERLDTGVLVLPRELGGKVGALPELRGFIVGRRRGEQRDWLVNPDYSQQELRILAHYEDGELLATYRANPKLDLHVHARKLIHDLTGRDYPRKYIKTTGFGIVYGMGLLKLVDRIGLDPESDEHIAEGKGLRAAYYQALPGVKVLDDELKRRGRRKEPIRTYGGRVYTCERPRIVEGKLRTFEYKLLNTLIQGSAADCTKEGMLNYFEHPKREGYLLLQAHDELLAGCAPDETALRREAELLASCMEDVRFDLPMLTDTKVSRRSWADGVSL